VNIEQLLAPLHPDEHALAALFRAHVDETMLREIAAADYGWMADECNALLLPMWRDGAAAAVDGNLREVLELIRWSEPEDPAWAPGGHGERGHWMRLFACAGLLRMAPWQREFFDGESSTLAQFLVSARVLGPAAARASAGVLAWRWREYPGSTEDAPHLAFAILLLATELASAAGDGAWLKGLADWVEAEEAKARRALLPYRAALPYWDNWLLGLLFGDLRDSVWRRLALEILARPAVPHPAEARDELQLLGELVAGI